MINNCKFFLKSVRTFLHDSVFFYAVLGFVLGATLPIYFIFNKNPNAIGDLGEWIGSLLTAAAVITSLYLARQNSIARIELKLGNFNPLFNSNEIMFDIVNYGAISTSVRVRIELDKNFVSKYLNYFNDNNDKMRAIVSLKRIVESSIWDKDGNLIKPLQDFPISFHSRKSIFVEQDIIEQWLYYNSPISDTVIISFFLEDMNGKIIKKQISKYSFLNKFDSDFGQLLIKKSGKMVYLPVVI